MSIAKILIASPKVSLAKLLHAGFAVFSMAVGTAGSSVNAVLPIVVAIACMTAPNEVAAKSGLRSSGGYRLRTPSIGSQSLEPHAIDQRRLSASGYFFV